MFEICFIIRPDIAMPTPWLVLPPLRNIRPIVGKINCSSRSCLQISLKKKMSYSHCESSMQKSWNRDSDWMLWKFLVIMCRLNGAWWQSFVAVSVGDSSILAANFPLSCCLWSHTPYSISTMNSVNASFTIADGTSAWCHSTVKSSCTLATGVSVPFRRTTTLNIL